MRYERYDCSAACPIAAALEVIGGKWKVMALYYLLDGKKRFNELKLEVNEATQRMLTKQLRELELDGLISRHVYAEVPPKVEYCLTKNGKALRLILLALEKWGAQYVFEKSPARSA